MGAIALTAALLMTLSGAAAFDETKYPDWSGTWRRAPGASIGWDESKPVGRAQQPPLTPEYRAIWEASMADQDAGGQGGDTRVTCVSNGMPRLMTVIRPIEFVILPAITYVVYENNLPRRIYTDGKGFLQRAGQIPFVRNVRLNRRDGGAFGGQFGGNFLAGGGRSTAAEEDQVPRALFHQPAGDRESQASAPSRDQIRGIGLRSSAHQHRQRFRERTHGRALAPRRNRAERRRRRAGARAGAKAA